MAHNINVTNGKASFFSAVQPAWHGLGQILDAPATSEQAMEAAGLNYEVALQPVYCSISQPDGDNINLEVPGKFATYRTDTNNIFGIVGSRYNIVQNSEAFNFFDAIVGEGAAIYETAGALGNGETVFITAKMPSHIKLAGEEIENYLLATMKHDGTGAIQAMLTPTRTVCANTLALALSNATHKVSIRHTKNAQQALQEAHKIMGITNELTAQLGDLFNGMAKKAITDSIAYEYFNNCFLTRDELTALAKGEQLSAQKANMLEGVKKYYFEGVGQDTKQTRGTVWGAYNAITGYLQNGKSYKDSEAKMKSLLLGRDYDLSAAALNKATALVF